MFGKGKTPDELERAAQLRRRLSISVTAFGLIGSLVLLGVCQPWRSSQESSPADTTKKQVQTPDTATGLSASGTTVLATVDQILDFDPDDYDIQVESIQAPAGTTVAIGDPLLTLSSDSVKHARSTLLREVAAAQNKFNQATLDYQTTLAQIKATLDQNRALGSIAGQDYTIALFDLQQTVDDAKAAMDEAHAVITNHPARLVDAAQELVYAEHDLDDAKEDAEDSSGDLQAANREKAIAAQAVASYQAILDFLDEQEADLDSDQFADVRDIAGNRLADAQAALAAANPKVQAASEEFSRDQSQVSNLQSVVSQYETLVETLTDELDTAKRDLAKIELDYNKANLALIAESIELELDYQTSLLEFKSADAQYTQSLQDAQATYTTADRTLSIATAALATFDAEIADGVIEARFSGPVTKLGYEAGDTLASATPVATLQNAAQVSISVTIDQADISQLAIGDPAEVVIRSVGQTPLAAAITRIDPIANSFSMSNVYYTVVVTLDDSATPVTDDLDATVTFQAAA
jgi:hypothetical protein